MAKKQIKPKLKLTEKKVFEVNYHDFEEFVKKIYNTEDYSFVAVEECGNDSTHEFTPDGKINDKWEQEEYDKIIGGTIDTYRNHDLFNALVIDGYLKPGCYMVSVSW